MWKKMLPALVFGAFISLIIFASYLFISLRNKEITTKTPVSSTEIERISQEPTDPIKKTVPPDGGSIVYEIEGKLSGVFVKQGLLLKGELIIKGDPLERKILVYLGSVDGTSSFGSYKGSFSGDSSWTKTSITEIAEEIEADESVLILVQYPVTGEESDLKTRKHEEILDGLISEFKNKNFNFQIPIDFELAASRIGVIR